MIMTCRATVTLDPDVFAFLQKMGGTNRSGYLNELLKREQQRVLEQAVLEANRQEAQDAAYQEELATWERTLADGLEPV
jgi:hypothetical protein